LRVEYACTSPGVGSGGDAISGKSKSMRRMLLIIAVVLFGALASAQAQDAATTRLTIWLP